LSIAILYNCHFVNRIINHIESLNVPDMRT
jgi:hypothetical protein